MLYDSDGEFLCDIELNREVVGDVPINLTVRGNSVFGHDVHIGVADGSLSYNITDSDPHDNEVALSLLDDESSLVFSPNGRRRTRSRMRRFVAGLVTMIGGVAAGVPMVEVGICDGDECEEINAPVFGAGIALVGIGLGVGLPLLMAGGKVASYDIGVSE
jgi:hypothetical protein